MTPSPKDIKEYFEVEISKIRPDQEISFDLHIYFSRNQHLITWKRRGDIPSPDALGKYARGGLKVFWVHRSDRDAYLRYLNPEAAAAEAPISVAEVELPQAPAPEPDLFAMATAPAAAAPALVAEFSVPAATGPDLFEMALAEVPEPASAETSGEKPYATRDSQRLTEALKAETNPEKKSKQVASIAQDVLCQIVDAKDAQSQRILDDRLRKTIRDVLERVANHNQSVAAEIWGLSERDPLLNHGVNVGSYATLLAMAFGRIDPELLGDIALAGLLHDVGVASFSISELPDRMSDGARVSETGYVKHVEASLAFIRSSPLAGRERVIQMIHQHHEKFDGSGYPGKMQGFKIDDLSQILAMADFLEELSGGEWDGMLRTRGQALFEIEGMEKTRTFPHFFNPELFGPVLKWLRSVGIEFRSDNKLKSA